MLTPSEGDNKSYMMVNKAASTVSQQVRYPSAHVTVPPVAAAAKTMTALLPAARALPPAGATVAELLPAIAASRLHSSALIIPAVASTTTLPATALVLVLELPSAAQTAASRATAKKESMNYAAALSGSSWASSYTRKHLLSFLRWRSSVISATAAIDKGSFAATQATAASSDTKSSSATRTLLQDPPPCMSDAVLTDDTTPGAFVVTPDTALQEAVNCRGTVTINALVASVVSKCACLNAIVYFHEKIRCHFPGNQTHLGLTPELVVAESGSCDMHECALTPTSHS